jgi:hypothetical protein
MFKILFPTSKEKHKPYRNNLVAVSGAIRAADWKQ